MHKYQILVAEDDVFSANEYRSHLVQNNFEVSLAFNGQQALDQVDTFKPDLIILDLIMPQIDGFTVLSHLKKAQSKIPVIVISNLNQPSDIQKCLDLGAHLFITKTSLDYPKLISTINQILS